MLPKKNRANKKDIEKLFKNRGFLSCPTLTFRYIKLDNLPKMPIGTISTKSKSDLDSRISFVVPKKVTKSAVLRNKLRRIGYIALEKHLNLLNTPVSGVFSFTKNNTDNIENEIKDLLSKTTNKFN